MTGPQWQTSHPHEALVEDLVRETSSLLRDLGEITSTTYREFEKGLYGCLTLRPNKKVSLSLSTTREVVVIVTPFTDLQQRTVKFTKQLITDSKGRLDNSIALIAHQDPGGDTALREWGKDVALLILPIFLRGEWREHSSLESLLSRHLYSADPFDLAGPVRNENQFYGRADAADVARRLSKGEVKAYFGIRKIGKTSMMNRIIGYASNSYNTACIFVDCQADGIWTMDAAALLDSITGAVLEVSDDSTNLYRSVIPTKMESTLADAQFQLQYAIDRAPRTVLVAIDEVDFISPSSPTATHWAQEFNKFFRALRTVYQESCRTSGRLSILIGGVSSRWFFVESIGGVENAALGFVPEEYLTPFHRAQSLNMIRALGRSAGLTFSDASADVLAEACGDFPFWIRKCGSFIHSSLDPEDRPLLVNETQCRELVREFVAGPGSELAEVSLRHVLRVFPELVPAAMASYVGEAVNGRQETRMLNVLKKYGVVDSAGALRGPLVVSGIEAALESLEAAGEGMPSTKSAPPSVAELLDVMETDRVEFKASARFSYKPAVPEKTLHDEVIKTIAAFLNASGGTLAIGIDDDGRVLGIEPDLGLFAGRSDSDAYLNWLTTLLTKGLGGAATALVRVRFEVNSEKVVCLADVEPSPTPVFATTSKGAEVFFVRMNNTSRQLDGQELLRYTKQHWSG